MSTFGIHLVTSTYGTWLPGDDRGHWSPLLDFYGHLREAGHHLRMGDVATESGSRARMTEPERVLTPDDQLTIANVIGEIVTTPVVSTTRGRRAVLQPPTVYAAAIERTHMHILIGILREDVDRFMGRIKGRSASAVLAPRGDEGRKHVWTTGYWRVFLFDHPAVDAAQEYIAAHNVRRGLPAAPYEWVHPRRVRRK